MKTTVMVLIMLFGMIFFGKAQSIQSDESQIRETLSSYLNGRNNGDTTLLKKAFHPKAELRYLKRDSIFTIWPINDYIENVKPNAKNNCKSRIVFIDVMGSAAQAKIEIEYPNWKYADYLNLLKLDGKWVIAVKTFSGKAIKNNKRVLFVLTSNEKMGDTDRKTGLHLGEVSHVYKPLYDSGIDIDFVSPKGGKTRMYGTDMNDSLNLWFVQDPTAFYRFTHAMKPEEIIPENYAAIYFVGGHGTLWDLPQNEQLQNITKTIYESDGLVAGICHGLSGLINVKLTDGNWLMKNKRITSFTNQEERAAKQDKIVPFLLESKLIERGAIFDGAKNWQENVIVDGRLISGQNPASATLLAQRIIKLLFDK